MQQSSRGKWISGGLILILMIAAAVCGPIPGLDVMGTRALLLFFCFLISFLGGLLPGGISAIIFAMVMVFYGIYGSHNEALGNVSVSLMVFFIGADAITTALKTTNIPLRIAAFMAKLSRGNSTVLVILFVEAGFILSSIMSNLAACAALGTIAYGIYQEQSKSEAGAKNLGRALMIGVPLGCGVGGAGTIAGSVNNLTVLQMYESVTEGTVGFADWMILMYPTLLVTMALGGLIICLVFKPEPMSAEVMAASKNMTQEVGKMTANEIKVALIILAMLVFWIAGNWIPLFNTSFVAFAGLVLFIFPGIGCMTVKDWMQAANWDTILLSGGIMATVGGLTATGVTDWFGNLMIGMVGDLSPYFLGVIVTAMGFILHAFVPIGGPVAAILTIPAISMAQACGLNPVVAILLVACGASGGTLLPVDLLPVMTKGYGLYSSKDFTLAGIPVTIMLCILLPAILIPLAGIFF